VGPIQVLAEFLSSAHLRLVFATHYLLLRPDPTSRKVREKWSALAYRDSW
jgi:hypothetical protein